MDILLAEAIRPARPALVAAGAGSDTHTPPQSVVSNAKRALELIADGKAGAGFTDVGRARARQLAAGTAVSTSTVRKMHAYFARHAEGDQGQQNQAGTPANVAWLAWGGDAGKRWADSIVAQLDQSVAASGEMVAVLDGDTWRFDPSVDVDEPFTTSLPSDELAATTAAAIPVAPPAAWFDDPQLDQPTALTVTADGRVFGHAAAWGVRHIGLPGHRTAPNSRSGYRYFRTGQVETADGSMVATGRITMGAGHADLHGNLTAASEHYDNVCAAVADVACGEDAHGIWFAGALRPDVTPSQVRTLRASSLSGDWRPAGNDLEMVGLLAVNVPGFPTPRAALAASGEAVCALVAAGVVLRADPDLDDGVTAAGHRSGGGGFRYRHGWIPLDGTRDDEESDRPDYGRGSEAVRVARSEARGRLDAALARLDKVQPEVARRQRAELNELRESGKLTADRMRTATDAATRAAVPSGLGADKFGSKPAASKPSGGGPGGRDDDLVDVTNRGGDGIGKGDGSGVNSHLDRLRDRKGAARDQHLKSMTDDEIRKTHAAAREQHAKTNSPSGKADLAEVAGALKREHQARKASRAAKAGDPVDVTSRANGGDGYGKGKGHGGNSHVDILRDRRSDGSKFSREAHLKTMSDTDIKRTHEAVREQHAAAKSPSAKADLADVAAALRVEHQVRKSAKATTAASGVLVAASDASVSRQQRDQAAVKKAPARKAPAPKKVATGKATATKSSSGGSSSSFDEAKHPRQPAGGSGGGQFAPAGGEGKDAAGKAAQQNKTAQGNYLALDKLKGPDAAKFLKGLSEKDLKDLTAIAYSAKSSDKKVVANRIAVANEMGNRGLDIKKNGARGGGKTGATRASAYSEESTMTEHDGVTAAVRDDEEIEPLEAAGDEETPTPGGYAAGDSVALGDTGIVGHVVDTDDSTGHLTVEVTVGAEDVQAADSDQAMAASARRTDAARDRARDRMLEQLSGMVASLSSRLDERNAEVTRLVEDRRNREADALLASLPADLPADLPAG